MKKIELWVTPSMGGVVTDFWENEPTIHEGTGMYVGKCVGYLKIAKQLGDIKKIKKITITMEDEL